MPQQYHSLFLKNDGSLWGMGDNSYGQLGDGTYNSTNRPEQICAASRRLPQENDKTPHS